MGIQDDKAQVVFYYILFYLIDEIKKKYEVMLSGGKWLEGIKPFILKVELFYIAHLKLI